MLSEWHHAAVAAALAAAERDCAPIEPPTTTWPGFDVGDAYAVQLCNVRERRAVGGVVYGHKVGLTSRQMQEMLGVDEPDYGHLFEDMVVADGGEAAVAELCSPRVEIEVAFVLNRALVGPGITPAQVLAATEAVAPAIEVIDSRIRDWRITLADTIADNASSARVVLGPATAAPDDLAGLRAVLRRNGEPVESGLSGAVLGHPARAVAWLANTLARVGRSLDAGHVVMPGACTRAVDVHAGDEIVGELDGIGSVSVRFS